jgi:hypothetical protein
MRYGAHKLPMEQWLPIRSGRPCPCHEPARPLHRIPWRRSLTGEDDGTPFVHPVIKAWHVGAKSR